MHPTAAATRRTSWLNSATERTVAALTGASRGRSPRRRDLSIMNTAASSSPARASEYAALNGALLASANSRRELAPGCPLSRSTALFAVRNASAASCH